MTADAKEARECRHASPAEGRGIDDQGGAAGSQMTLPLREESDVTTAHEFDGANFGSAAESEAAAPAEAKSLGGRLRAAREARGWNVGDVVAELRIPARIIERLENDDYAGFNDAVFLRGYLKSYARLVGVPVDETARIVDAHAHVAPLVATGTISRSRYLFERYSASATYLTLTAIIVVPAVWLATHGGLQQNLARVTPLDPPPAHVADVAQNESVPDSQAGSSNADATADAPSAATSTPLTIPPVEQAPIVASMTPFQVAHPPETATAATTETSGNKPASNGQGAHIVTLKIAQPSWVEVTAADGRKLEYSMLPAGTEHEYRSDGTVSVRLGNAQGAEVHADGNVIDLAPFQRGNVAHLKLFGENGTSAERPQQ